MINNDIENYRGESKSKDDRNRGTRYRERFIKRLKKDFKKVLKRFKKGLKSC